MEHRIRIVAMVAMVAMACSLREDSGPGSPPDGGSDAPSDADPSCHWDCFGLHECHDGVVTTMRHGPVPCEHWQGVCPRRESFRCERGCRTDVTYLYPGAEAREMCEEHRPKQVGDPCRDDSECRPEVATWDAQGNVTNVYLRCDVAAGTCVAREPPVVADWLAPCGLVPDDSPGFAYGVTASAACSGGLCAFLETETCVKQGCTIPCSTDGQCPVGAVCEEGTYCKPGPPNLIGVGLSCPP